MIAYPKFGSIVIVAIIAVVGDVYEECDAGFYSGSGVFAKTRLWISCVTGMCFLMYLNNRKLQLAVRGDVLGFA